ncbi:Hypothetical protein OINT_2001471 [Brucella intermedia LMG 3301]|uniref:Uncharacterized protein n=1 Tax=Brucella intermedia LMG 3301 TaxID=641118 RepID=C4WPD8_9HYPH|nr:Hypothetical protein OINT_2001471 [Brucella intermedia LMG 3301]
MLPFLFLNDAHWSRRYYPDIDRPVLIICDRQVSVEEEFWRSLAADNANNFETAMTSIFNVSLSGKSWNDEQ